MQVRQRGFARQATFENYQPAGEPYHRLGSVKAYRIVIPPALKNAQGNHSFGRHSRVIDAGLPIGLMKLWALVSEAE